MAGLLMAQHKIPYTRAFVSARRKFDPESTESVKLTRLKNDKGRTIGYVNPETGQLYNRRHQKAVPVTDRTGGIGFRRSVTYQQLRAAADDLGVAVSGPVRFAEERELKVISDESDF